MMKMKINSVLQSLILIKSFQSSPMKLRTELIDIVLLVNISLRAFFCLKLVLDDSLCTLYKHVVMLFYIFFLGKGLCITASGNIPASSTVELPKK